VRSLPPWLRAKPLKGEIQVLQRESAALASAVECAQSDAQRTGLTRLRDGAVTRSYALQLLVDLLERKEGKGQLS
jgi:hypothetical protein